MTCSCNTAAACDAGIMTAHAAAWALSGFIAGVAASSVLGYVLRDRIKAWLIRKRRSG